MTPFDASVPEREAPRDVDGIADLVRSFYETHPYPRPVNDLDSYRKRWTDPERQRAEDLLLWPDGSARPDRSILIAGCGTSQAAKYALRYPEAHVTGVDVSATSIERTRALKTRHGLDRLDLVQMPVENVTTLGRSFDHVVCTGVLHHLPDPDAGLRALRTVLAPHGAMQIMVYAPYGRTGVYMLQQYCRRVGIGTTHADVQELAAALQALPERHPLRLLADSADFRTEAGIADALLNPNDRAYAVPELFTFLRRGALRFGRWLRQAPYLPHCGIGRAIPHYARLAGMPAEEQYAVLELFRGTMVRHSAIVHGDDDPDAQPIRFDGDAWRNFVPVRLPDTICVEERLPPGAAGVLINRTHTDTDLYLPIDGREKAWFHAVDGRRTTHEIGAGGDADADAARRFFEQLWHYDQVVFDTSRHNDPDTSDPGG